MELQEALAPQYYIAIWHMLGIALLYCIEHLKGISTQTMILIAIITCPILGFVASIYAGFRWWIKRKDK